MEEVGEQEGREVVDLEVRLVAVGGRPGRGEGAAGVVHQHVQRADPLGDLLGQAAYVVEAGEVGDQGLGADGLRDRPQLVEGASGDVHRRASRRQHACRLGADPVARPGHQDRTARHRLLSHAPSLGGA